MKSQDQIIYGTEVVVEQIRQYIAESKSNISDPGIKSCYISLENLLFEFVVFLYTHRTIWTQHNFWHGYAKSQNPIVFAEAAYKQIILSILTNFYSKLYFYLEGALFTHLQINHIRPKDSLLDMYQQINEGILPNFDETKRGLEILRCVRNSSHGNNGNFIFSYPDVKINFKGVQYFFQKDEPTSVSYKFISDFLPNVNDLYAALFSTT